MTPPIQFAHVPSRTKPRKYGAFLLYAITLTAATVAAGCMTFGG